MLDTNPSLSRVQSPPAQIPVPGEIMPDLNLISTGRANVRISNYRSRRNLILIFSGTGYSETVRRLLRNFSEIYSEFVSEEAQVLAVVQGSRDRAEQLERSDAISFPVLADEDGHAHIRVGVLGPEQNCTPVVYVVDRYGEIRHVSRAEESRAGLTPGEALDWIRYINLECPE